MKNVLIPRHATKYTVGTVALATLLCCAYYLCSQVLALSYWWAALAKVTLFSALPLWSLLHQKGTPGLRPFFSLRTSCKGLALGLIFGLLAAGIILAGFVLVGPLLDQGAIVQAIVQTAGVNRYTYPLLALYVSFGNSFLEEFFFRGFLFLSLREEIGAIPAHGISAGLFSLYHMSMLGIALSPLLVAGMLLALFVAGLFFNVLDSRSGNLLNAWLVHILADLAITGIGCYLFWSAPPF